MAEPTGNRQPFIIISVIMVLILVGYFIYLIIASSTESGPFKPYAPPTSSDFWYPRGAEQVPLTEEQQAMKQSLLAQSLSDVTAAINLAAPA